MKSTNKVSFEQDVLQSKKTVLLDVLGSLVCSMSWYGTNFGINKC